jgi:hypothetical protein
MNGDLSLVMAEDRDDAMIRLDEFGNAEEAELYEIGDLMVDLRLEDDGTLAIAHWGDLTREAIMELAFPHLEAAMHDALDDGEDLDAAGRAGRFRAAVELERTRLRPEEGQSTEGPQARTELGREVQRSMGAPAVLIDRLVEAVGEKILEKAKPKGPAN